MDYHSIQKRGQFLKTPLKPSLELFSFNAVHFHEVSYGTYDVTDTCDHKNVNIGVGDARIRFEATARMLSARRYYSLIYASQLTGSNILQLTAWTNIDGANCYAVTKINNFGTYKRNITANSVLQVRI